jgi:hypothetical protein
VSLPTVSDLDSLGLFFGGAPFADTSIVTGSGSLKCLYKGMPFVASENTGLTHYIADTITLSDSRVVSIGKGLRDIMSVVDLCAKGFSRDLADSLSLSDGLGTYHLVVLLHLLDLSDTITLTDAAGKGMGKPISDAVSIADSVAKTGFRTIADAVHVDDAISGKSIATFRADIISVIDAVKKQGRRIDADVISLIESIGKRLNTVRSDIVGMSESMSSDVRKNRSDTIVATDSIIKAMSVTKNDDIEIIESNMLTLMPFKYIIIGSEWRTVDHVSILIGGEWKEASISILILADWEQPL